MKDVLRVIAGIVVLILLSGAYISWHTRYELQNKIGFCEYAQRENLTSPMELCRTYYQTGNPDDINL